MGFLFNLYLQPILGIKAAGYAQIVAYSVSGVIVHKYSQKFMPIGYNIKWALGILMVMTGCIVLLGLSEVWYSQSPHITYLVIGGLTLLVLGVIGENKYHFIQLVKDFYQKRHK